MNLSPYLESVRHGVVNAAALADDATQQVAARLGTAIDSSTRLALIEALSDAAGAISADLAPGSVDLRMNGADPEFVVSPPPVAAAEPTLLLPPSDEPPAVEDPDAEEEPLARVSLRLPQSVKAKADEMADRDGISTNAWLIRAVVDALADRSEPRWGGPRHSSTAGWAPGPPPIPTPPQPGGNPVVNAVLGPDGPFGPQGLFGPQGPFGPQGSFGRGRGGHPGGRRRRDDASGEDGRGAHGGRSSGGGVQGWVR